LSGQHPRLTLTEPMLSRAAKWLISVEAGVLATDRDQTASRWSAPGPGKRTCREDHAPSHRPQMSSDRLFLDRVARQHCPSPLHRHAQTTTPPYPARPKPDISTLQRIGHFYFALTRRCAGVHASHTNRRITKGCKVYTFNVFSESSLTEPTESSCSGRRASLPLDSRSTEPCFPLSRIWCW
jgi:hypothetical protein